MRYKRLGALLPAVLMTVMLLIPETALAEEFPYGKYSGSAVGSGENSTPIAVTIYLNDAGEDGVEVTVVTKSLPIPVSVKTSASSAGSGWDLPAAVDVGSIRLSGSGTLRLRKQADGKWVMYGSGSGSFRDNSGGGRGYATRTKEESSAGEQVMDALGGFFNPSGGTEGEKPPVPPEYDESEWGGGTAGETPGDDVSDTGAAIDSEQPPATAAVEEVEPPLAPYEIIFALGFLMLLEFILMFL